jgi:5S rRNA maturation endonuclease (ribonuclease M5)
MEISRQLIEDLPNFKLRVRYSQEYSSSCPVCGGYDRFRFWATHGRYWCRQCDLSGYITEMGGEEIPVDSSDIGGIRQLMAVKESEAYDLKRLNDNKIWINYNRNLDRFPEAKDYWIKAIGQAAIDKFQVGYSPTCPIAPWTDSYVIPVFDSFGLLLHLRHRLIKYAKAKYLPEPLHPRPALFNQEVLNHVNSILIVEGEKKVMRLYSEGIPAITSTAGCSGFMRRWFYKLRNMEAVYVIFDPDKPGTTAAEDLADALMEFCVEAHAVILDYKIDDGFNEGMDINYLIDRIGEDPRRFYR